MTVPPSCSKVATSMNGRERHLVGARWQIDGVTGLLRPATTLLLGEVHGTREVPAFVGALAHTVTEKLGVSLALEIPRQEQERIDAFMASAGTERDRAALLQGDFWKLRDGRSSLAMLDLIEHLRRLSRESGKVRLIAIDDEGNALSPDEQMAENVLRHRHARKSDVMIVLTGNLHSRIEEGNPWDTDFRSMGWHLAQERIPLVSLEARYATGTAWNCDGEMSGVVPILGAADDPARPRSTSLVDPREGFHGTFFVGTAHASQPAQSILPANGLSECRARERHPDRDRK
jgi:hypothetical protein